MVNVTNSNIASGIDITINFTNSYINIKVRFIAYSFVSNLL